jgi:ubiquinone/menaquinone biosynthesis C-methylase UbiE
MTTIDETKLSSLLSGDFTLRPVEPNIYSVLVKDKTGNEYDSQFGFLYDLVACSPIYNRLIWGYSVKIFPNIANEALHSNSAGNVLDLGCGSLAFTAKAYSQYADRPVVLVDRSLKMLRMAKSRLIKQNGRVPDNLVFLHADVLHLPFRESAFNTIISMNLLHCLDDTGPLLKKIEKILVPKGKIYFTTLVRGNRWADKYLQALADSGKLVSRSVVDHKNIFKQVGLEAKFETMGNMLSIHCVNPNVA